MSASEARLAQSVERKALNLVVVGSSPTVGAVFFPICLLLSGGTDSPLHCPHGRKKQSFRTSLQSTHK